MRAVLLVLGLGALAVAPAPAQVAPAPLPGAPRLASGVSGGSSVEALEERLARSPRDARIRRALAVARLARGDTARAEEVLDAGTRGALPADDPVLLLQALVELRVLGERWDDALEAWRRIPAGERDPAMGSVLLLNRGLVDLRAGRREAAAARFGEARALDPDNPLLGLRLAETLRRGGAPAQALALYDELVSAPEPPPAVFQAVGGLWVSLARPDTAAALLRRGVALHPGEGGLWQLLGRAQEARDSLDAAYDAYRRAAPLLERSAAGLLPAAEAAAASGRSDEARATLAQLVGAGTPRVDLLVAGHRAFRRGWVPVASAAAEELLRRDGDDAQALELAARTAEAAGEWAAALAAYRRLGSRSVGLAGLARLGQLPTDSAATLERRALWAAMEELAGTEEESAAVGGAAPEPAPWVSDWRASRRDERRARLEALLDRMVLEAPDGSELLAALREAWAESALLGWYAGERALLEGRPGEALSYFDRSVARHPAEASHHRGRGRALEALDRPGAALGAWARALELAPEDPEAFRALVRLRSTSGALEPLLERVRRLRALEPGSRVLAEREVEVLQRLGRLEDARRVAEDLARTEEEG